MDIGATSPQIKIDIVIPSVRPSDLNFEALLGMTTPSNVSVKFIIVIDNPRLDGFNGSDLNLSNVYFIYNETNLGAPRSRNIGLDACSGDYVLFLDDDIFPDKNLLVRYVNAIRANPSSPGFVGTTMFPKPVNSFTRGIIASDILTFFGIANTHKTVSWGVTSNIMLKLEAVGNTRFDPSFPKSGGGEDIDFCLRVISGTDLPFISVPRALVTHDWWNKARRQYKRFFRWAYGDSRLSKIHPQYGYRNFPNFIEVLFFGLTILIVLFSLSLVNWMDFIFFLVISTMTELVGELLRVRYLRPRFKAAWVLEGEIIRLSNDLGRFAGHLSRGEFLSFFERFDYFTTRESIPFERKIALLKFLVFLVTFMAVMLVA